MDHHHEPTTPLSDARLPAAPAAATPGPSSHSPGSSHDDPKQESHQADAPVDSGVDAGSSSEYDQPNSGDHLLEAHNHHQDDEGFTDEG